MFGKILLPKKKKKVTRFCLFLNNLGWWSGSSGKAPA
jgi:hypothetical protein